MCLCNSVRTINKPLFKEKNMKPLIIGISLLFLFSSKVNGQINYTPFEFANYFIVSRGVYINYYEDVKELIIVDNKEGITLNCNSIGTDNIDLDKKTKYDQPMFFDKTWEFYDDLIDVGIILYIPKGQNLEDCEEMISIQRIDAQGQGSKKLYKNLMKQRDKNCPGKNKSEILTESKNSIIYQAITEACGEFDFQAEWTVILSPPKLTLFQYTLWKIEYVVKNKNWEQFMTNEKREWLQNIKLLTGKELKAYIDIH